MEVILLVLDASYTDQENGCQAMHEQETQNVVVLHLARRTGLHNWPNEKQPATRNCQACSCGETEGNKKDSKMIVMFGSSVMLICSETRQDRQCMYNVTFRRVRATNVAVAKQWVLHNLSVCICSLRYPACNAHAPYCHLWPASLYNIFPHCNRTDKVEFILEGEG